MLEDGTYDAVVVDAEEADGGAIALDLAVLAGPHKGELVRITGPIPGRDPLDLLALPATITVAGGEPSVVLED